MIKIYFVYSDKNGEHEDSAKVESPKTAEDELIELIRYFNVMEKGRYGKEAVLRKFVRIVEDGKSKLKKNMDDAYDALIHGPGNKEKK